MKTGFKKAFSLLLAAVMLLCAFPFAVNAASSKTSGVYTYTVKNKEATITDCKESAKGSLTIPSKLGGYPVTAIGKEAFADCVSLKSVVIPSGAKKISEAAFFCCTSLVSVKLPKKLESIGEGAFYCTPLKSVTIPDSVQKIGSSAFGFCTKLATLKLGSGLRTIGDGAFSCTALKSATVPKSVTKIGVAIFGGCSALAGVSVASGNKVYHSKNNCIIKTKTKELCDSVRQKRDKDW